MSPVYCYPVKMMIADLIRGKSICSHTAGSVQPYNNPIIDLACSVCTLKYQTYVFFFAWTSLIRRSFHTKKPRSDISQYRPHARLISSYVLKNFNAKS